MDECDQVTQRSYGGTESAPDGEGSESGESMRQDPSEDIQEANQGSSSRSCGRSTQRSTEATGVGKGISKRRRPKNGCKSCQLCSLGNWASHTSRWTDDQKLFKCIASTDITESGGEGICTLWDCPPKSRQMGSSLSHKKHSKTVRNLVRIEMARKEKEGEVFRWDEKRLKRDLDPEVKPRGANSATAATVTQGSG